MSVVDFKAFREARLSTAEPPSPGPQAGRPRTSSRGEAANDAETLHSRLLDELVAELQPSARASATVLAGPNGATKRKLASTSAPAGQTAAVQALRGPGVTLQEEHLARLDAPTGPAGFIDVELESTTVLRVAASLGGILTRAQTATAALNSALIDAANVEPALATARKGPRARVLAQRMLHDIGSIARDLLSATGKLEDALDTLGIAVRAYEASSARSFAERQIDATMKSKDGITQAALRHLAHAKTSLERTFG